MRARTRTILEFLPIRFYYLVAIFNRGWFMLNFHKLNRFVCIKTQKTHANKHTCTHIHVRSHQKAEEEQKYFCDVIEFAAYNCGSVCVCVSVFLMPFAKLPENQFTLPNSVTCTYTHTYIQVTHTHTHTLSCDSRNDAWRESADMTCVFCKKVKAQRGPHSARNFCQLKSKERFSHERSGAWKTERESDEPDRMQVRRRVAVTFALALRALSCCLSLSQSSLLCGWVCVCACACTCMHGRTSAWSTESEDKQVRWDQQARERARERFGVIEYVSDGWLLGCNMRPCATWVNGEDADAAV